MATKFGRIDSSGTSFEEQTFNKGQTLTSASDGVHYQLGIKDCKSQNPSGPCDNDPGSVLNTSGIHWATIHTMFYMSGSTKVSESMGPGEIEKFNSIYHNFNQHNDLKPFHTNKFYDSASIFYIPQVYIGNRIQPGSFQLTGRTGSYSNSTNQIIIKDDSNGNLYSTNAEHSQSATTGLSSKDNYVGNVFYDLGVAVLTETASWSGSVSYFDIGNTVPHQERTYNYWTMNLNSMTPIFTYQYSIKINSGDFNKSMNSSTKPFGEAEWMPSGSSLGDVANLRNELTASGWSPYFNQIQLYGSRDDESLIIANLPRAVKMRDDIDLIITFRLDA